MPSDPHRRHILKGALALSAAALVPAAKRDAGLIARENAKPGADSWQLTRVRLDKRGGHRTPWIEGYCSHQSIRAGETLRIFVSTNPPSKFEVEIFRTGYYGGKGARLMRTLGPLDGKTQPDPEVGPRRLRECKWEPSIELKIPDDWPSGVYLGRLTRRTGDALQADWQSYVIFIVKDDRPADVLFQCSDNTWQAYNCWPDDYSLYTHPGGPLVSNVDASFDRPYGLYPQIFENPQSLGSGEYLLWEYPLAYWLEQHGYDVTYCANADMLDPAQALRAKAFVSVGHDEYWDQRQYDSVKGAIEAGVNAMFLSGNSVCFISPYRASSSGQKNRIVTRAGRYGGLSSKERKLGRMGPFSVEGPNENLIIGARTISPFNGGGDWIVTKPDHWIFDGTGMRKGDAVPGLVGWEFHGDPADLPGLEIVAEGIALSGGVEPAHWTATVYPGPKGNVVFNASTIWWAQGLSSPPGHMLPWSHWSRPHGPDLRVQRITQNVLMKALSGDRS